MYTRMFVGTCIVHTCINILHVSTHTHFVFPLICTRISPALLLSKSWLKEAKYLAQDDIETN